MPVANESLGAQRRLVEQHGHALRAGERLAERAVVAEREADLEDLALLGGREVVVAQEVPGGHQELLVVGSVVGSVVGAVLAVPAAAAAGSSGTVTDAKNATTSRAWSGVRIRGGARRIASGATALTTNPASSAARATSAATGRVSLDGEQETASAHPGDERVARRGDPVAQEPADGPDVLEQAVALDDAERRERRRGRHGVAAERRAVLAAAEQRRGALAVRDHRAHGEPAAEALGERDDVGHDAAPTSGCWYANHEPVRPTPVCTSSSTSSAPWRAVSSRAATR